MKTRIMILACLLAVPAGRMAAQQQTDPEQKATVQTQGDSIIIPERKKGEHAHQGVRRAVGRRRKERSTNL